MKRGLATDGEPATWNPRAMVKEASGEPLRICVRDALRFYFHNLGGHNVNDLYQMVIREVEQPLLETVLEHTSGNQTRAANILGISRSTLRKKLAKYEID